MDYNKCTHEELCRVIRDRYPIERREIRSMKHVRKALLVSRLQAMDKYATFRLLDLPPELRVKVYRHFLVATVPNDGSQVLLLRPGLLRTCKLIYQEAEPMLYNENELTISVNAGPDPDDTDDHGHAWESGRESCYWSHYTEISQPGPWWPYIHSEDDSPTHKIPRSGR